MPCLRKLTIVSQDILIQDSTLPLLSNIGNPNGSNLSAPRTHRLMEVVPQWFIHFLVDLVVRNSIVHQYTLHAVPWETHSHELR